MNTKHLDLDTVRRFGERSLGRVRTFRVAWHLFQCHQCRRLLAEAPAARDLFRTVFPKGGLVAPADASREYLPSFRRIAALLEERGVRIEGERGAAPGLAAELLSHSDSRRRSLIEERARFRTFALGEHLLMECRRTWADDPTGAEELAELALAVAGSLDPETYGPGIVNDLHAQGWAYVANCRRIRSDLPRVSEAFEIADELRSRGTGDPMEEAALLDLQASWLIDQRRFGDAEEALAGAVRRYREAEARHAEGRSLLKLARLRREGGRLPEAVEALETARSLLESDREPRLLLTLEQNLAAVLLDADRLLEAERALAVARRLAVEVGSDTDRLRVLWTDGVLHGRVGKVAAARKILTRVRDGFLEAGLDYDAALATLDLALLVLRAGDGAKARDLAREIVPLFSARGIHREAAAALTLVQQALRAEAATRGLVEEAAAYLRRARRNPVLRFRPKP